MAFGPGNQAGKGHGRPRKTPDEREAEKYLAEKTLRMAKRLYRLTGHADPHVACKALSIAMKVTLGEKKQVTTVHRPYAGLSESELDERIRSLEAGAAPQTH